MTDAVLYARAALLADAPALAGALAEARPLLGAVAFAWAGGALLPWAWPAAGAPLALPETTTRPGDEAILCGSTGSAHWRVYPAGSALTLLLDPPVPLPAGSFAAAYGAPRPLRAAADQALYLWGRRNAGDGGYREGRLAPVFAYTALGLPAATGGLHRAVLVVRPYQDPAGRPLFRPLRLQPAP